MIKRPSLKTWSMSDAEGHFRGIVLVNNYIVCRTPPYINNRCALKAAHWLQKRIIEIHQAMIEPNKSSALEEWLHDTSALPYPEEGRIND